MGHLTFLDPEWRALLEAHVDSARPDAFGNCDNIALAQASWVALLADCPGAEKPHKVLKKFHKRLIKDYRNTVAAAAKLYDQLVSSVIRTDDGYRVESLHKAFGRWPIFREYKLWYDTGNDDLLRYLGTFLLWAKKAEYLDPSLEEQGLESWLAIESELCRLDPPQKVLEDLKFILSYLPSPNYDAMSFKFGPGKVSEGNVDVFSDKLDIRYHPGLEAILDLVAGDTPISRYILPNPELWRLGQTEKAEASIDYATWLQVPKDYKSMRSICKEPNSLMYGQQGVLSSLLDAIRRSPFGRIIDITDQSRNAHLALSASRDGKYDTIDLSAASDRLSNRVLKQIFPHEWVVLFQALRSSRVKLPSGRIKSVEKFAPMGSALCFPVQTLVFTAVTCLARFIVSQGVTYEQYLSSAGLMPSKLVADWKTCVYGDDIICRSTDTDTVISLLEALGFRVNLQKSFYGLRAFRESCGTYAMRGKIVTPLMFKVKGLATQNLQYVKGLIDLCNRLYRAGMFSTHAFIARYIPRQFYVEVFDNETQPLPEHLFSAEPDNTQLKRKFNKRSLRMEYRVKAYVTTVVPVLDDRASYFGIARFMQEPTLTLGSKPPVGDVVEPTVRPLWVTAQ